MNENPTAALRRAVLSGDHDAVNRETERLLQAMAFDLCHVSSKYGSDFHGLLMAAVESYLESLRQIADPQDLAIYQTLRDRITAVTVDSRFGRNGTL